MGVVYHKQFDKYKHDVWQTSEREISFVLKHKFGKFSVTGVHAPHAHKANRTKDSFYESLKKTSSLLKTKQADCHIIMGDFNARIHYATPEEKVLIGPNVFCSDLDVAAISTEMRDNRTRFMELFFDEGYVPMNTWFQKHWTNTCTFRSVGVRKFDHPFIHTK